MRVKRHNSPDLNQLAENVIITSLKMKKSKIRKIIFTILMYMSNIPLKDHLYIYNIPCIALASYYIFKIAVITGCYMYDIFLISQPIMIKKSRYDLSPGNAWAQTNPRYHEKETQNTECHNTIIVQQPAFSSSVCAKIA